MVFLDVRLPGMDGLTALGELKKIVPAAAVVVITAHGNLNTAVKAVEGGAFDYLAKPFDLAQRTTRQSGACQSRRDAAGQGRVPLAEVESSPDAIIGRSPAMQTVFKRIALVAPTAACVLVTGESGTGKELVARAFTPNSPRRGSRCLAAMSRPTTRTLWKANSSATSAGRSPARKRPVTVS